MSMWTASPVDERGSVGEVRAMDEVTKTTEETVTETTNPEPVEETTKEETTKEETTKETTKRDS